MSAIYWIIFFRLQEAKCLFFANIRTFIGLFFGFWDFYADNRDDRSLGVFKCFRHHILFPLCFSMLSDYRFGGLLWKKCKNGWYDVKLQLPHQMSILRIILLLSWVYCDYFIKHAFAIFYVYVFLTIKIMSHYWCGVPCNLNYHILDFKCR